MAFGSHALHCLKASVVLSRYVPGGQVWQVPIAVNYSPATHSLTETLMVYVALKTEDPSTSLSRSIINSNSNEKPGSEMIKKSEKWITPLVAKDLLPTSETVFPGAGKVLT